MTTRQKASEIAELLKEKYGDAKTPLTHTTDYELLFAVILSAQCTDARVNKVTPTLFSTYPKLKDYVDADIEDIKKIIHSTGFYNNKAKSIKGSAEKLLSDFSGKVPDTMDKLLTLPGVARKTANVMLSEWHGINEGFVVDTHVKRLANWFGFTKSQNPIIIEKDLMKLFPQEEWRVISLGMVLLGRETLTARNPEYTDTVWEKYLLL